MEISSLKLFFFFWEICQQQVTQKLLEAEKKKLTQLELQLDEDTAKHGISSVEKVIKINNAPYSVPGFLTLQLWLWGGSS